jgi:hypothetical protein
MVDLVAAVMNLSYVTTGNVSSEEKVNSGKYLCQRVYQLKSKWTG